MNFPIATIFPIATMWTARFPNTQILPGWAYTIGRAEMNHCTKCKIKDKKPVIQSNIKINTNDHEKNKHSPQELSFASRELNTRSKQKEVIGTK